MGQAIKEEYITPSEVVSRYKNLITVRTLANWRSNGDGPPFLKCGGRVLYSIQGLIDWEKSRSYGLGVFLAAIDRWEYFLI